MNLLEAQQPSSYSWEWLIGLGSLMIIFGIVALASPFGSSVALAWVIGALLLAGGVAQLVHSSRFAKAPGRVANFLYAALMLVSGALILRNPIAGTVGVTAVIAFYTLVGGITKLMLSIEIHPLEGWGYLLVSSLISIGLGVVLLVTFPTTSLFVPGLFFGIDLLFLGGSTIGFANSVRKAEKNITLIKERIKAA